MEEEIVTGPKRRCPAMIEAGIEDPDSQEGIDFCTHRGKYAISGGCPYPDCIVFESGRGAATLRRDRRAARAKDLTREGYKPKEIAKILGVKRRTVERYLEK